MCSESLPKEFEKAAEVLPFPKYGLSSLEEFKQVEENVRNLEYLKKAGLSGEEIKLFHDNKAGTVDQQSKMETTILQKKLGDIYHKISSLQGLDESSEEDDPQPGTSSDTDNILENPQKPLNFYPEGHPMNKIKDIEEDLFGYIKNDNMISITKRRKILRRFERKKERILMQEKQIDIGAGPNVNETNRPGSLWDVREMPQRKRPVREENNEHQNEKVIGPKNKTLYTIKNNKIMRLEPIAPEEQRDEYQAVDIVVPVNQAEAELLEGTKMCLDDIKSIERFRDYEPGIPSKVLYLKNIAPSVSQEQLSLLFNQFVLANGGPVDLRLMTGRMRGQAFAAFQNEDLAIQALEEINGTIVGGQPIIAQFGRNTNRIQNDDNR